MMRTLLLMASLSVILLGLAKHIPGKSTFQAEHIPKPTATPVTTAFDETVEVREIALGQQQWYAIQTGVYSTKEAAMSRADAYKDRGAPGYVTEDGGKWRVLIACYAQKNDADAVRQRLSTMQQVETHLHVWNMPEVTLRLSGMAGQLDVAQTGLDLPVRMAESLRDAAIALDAGECTMDDVWRIVETLKESVSVWSRTARERFDTPFPPLIASGLDVATAWETMYAALKTADDATALSAQLKKQAMAAFDQGRSMRARLTAE